MNTYKKKYIVFTALILILLLHVISIIQAKNKDQVIGRLTINEAYDKIQENKNNPDLVILDVRTEDEYNEGHIENAINIDYYSKSLKKDLNKLDKNKTYLVYCRSGSRSAKTVTIMEELGFKEVYNIGGMIDWTAAGYPSVK